MASIGMDESGKGAVLGPLIIVAVTLTPQAETVLRSAGVKDSKKLLPSRRTMLYGLIKQEALHIETVYLEAKDIDSMRQLQTINAIESNVFMGLVDRSVGVIKTSRLVEEEGAIRVQLDSLENNSFKYSLPFRDRFKPPHFNVQCETKGESKFIAVAAASIVAKVERDLAIQKLEAQVGQPIGCGYPSDATTMAFIQSYFEKYGEDHKDTNKDEQLQILLDIRKDIGKLTDSIRDLIKLLSPPGSK
eukprot:gene1110-1268_t